MLEKPHILIVDDNVDEHSAIKLLIEERDTGEVKILHPRDVTEDDLKDAHLVLVDYHIDEWIERDDLDEISLQPVDGLALSFLLRRRIHNTDFPPTAFALYTGKLEKLASPLPPEYREHALASINNLEWVFQKASSTSQSRTAEQVIELAHSVLELPREWGIDEENRPMRNLCDLLGINYDNPKDAVLIEEIESCLPPIHELSEWSHGIAVLRWILHKILPFPCFLLDKHRLAARFRLDYKQLETVLQPDTPLMRAIEDCSYQGILKNFLGVRWWRTKIESFLWDITKGESSNIRTVQDAIRDIAEINLTASSPSDYPIVCVNTNYQPLDDFYSIDECVRIRPDDYPAYADQAWTTIELAKGDMKFRSLIIQEDLHLIK